MESLSLNKLGFDEPCFGDHYNADDQEEFGEDHPWEKLGFDLEKSPKNNSHWKKTGEGAIAAPLWQQAFTWFEEIHNIFVERRIDTSVNEILDISYHLKSWRFKPVEIEFENPYDSFDKEKSKLACLKKIIEIVKNAENGQS